MDSNNDDDLVDEAGDEVLKFISATRNLSRIGELADQIVAIAKSGSWRHYKTAIGTAEWKEAEFDYFLIACDLRHEDIGRVVLHTNDWLTFAMVMDPDAGEDKRRPFEEAAQDWPSASPETLVQRAQRLGWTRSPDGSRLRAAPLPPRRQLYNVQNVTGNSQQTMLHRLAKSRPDLYRRVLANELSPSAAMREGGFIPRTISVNTDPEKAALTIRRHLDEGAIKRLIELLQASD